MHRTYGCSENPGRTRPLCDLCGKKFCQPQKLKVHMRRMHSGKKCDMKISDLRYYYRKNDFPRIFQFGRGHVNE